MKICTIGGCGRRHKGHGMCHMHLERFKKNHGRFMRASLEERFWTKVNRGGPNECWEWTASTNEHGYGKFGIGKAVVKAHRVSARLAGMEIEGLYVLHSCDNRLCVNPAHLRPGTAQDNADDMLARGRGARGSQIANVLTEADVVEIFEMSRAGMRQFEIADRFRCSPSLVSRVLSRQVWQHVDLGGAA